MKKRKLKPDFDPKYLDTLVNDEGSCVHILRSKHHLALHPYHLNDLNTSVKEILNKGIAKYNPELDGILFGYTNITFLSHLGNIVDDSCFIHVDIEADFYIFKPVVGQTLQGVVKKKSNDHVGCLVHKIFNVSLPKPKKEDDWIGSSIKLNSEILLVVTHTDFGGKLPYIRGKIESVLSEPEIDDIENNITLLGAENIKAKKIRFDDDSEVLDKTVEEELETPKRKRKKSKSESFNNTEEEMGSQKKKRQKSISETFGIAKEEEMESPKKKRKKSKSESLEYTEEEMEPPKKKRKKSSSKVFDNDNTEEETESAKKKSRKSKKLDTSTEYYQ